MIEVMGYSPTTGHVPKGRERDKVRGSLEKMGKEKVINRSILVCVYTIGRAHWVLSKGAACA